MSTYKPRYPGTRWCILFGQYDGIEQFALDELQRMVQRFLPFVVQTRAAAGEAGASDEHLMLIGTEANNPLIAQLADQKLIALPAQPQGYTITSLASPWCAGRKLVVIAGGDARGVLYGVEDLNARILAGRLADDPLQSRAALDDIPALCVCESPSVEHRGIWTWGYVIYDYRSFLDNMARLKLNMLVIWNDCPPLNCRQVIAYAHARGVKVILGFHWGWGMSLNLDSPDDRRQIREHVLETYRRDYRDLGMDGIYFQTLTEHTMTAVAGQSTAALACRLVNETAHALYAEDAGPYIQFGLHATSIQDNYRDLSALDSRIDIVWEDAGVIPYSYDPLPDPQRSIWDAVATPAGTIAYSRNLATLRGRNELALVAKGWTKLNWSDEFEHHGPFILGERDRAWMAERLQAMQPIWERVNQLWQRNGGYARDFYHQMRRTVDRLTVLALVEDGLFELAIQPGVALFAQTLWNVECSTEELLTIAGSAYYGDGWPKGEPGPTAWPG